MSGTFIFIETIRPQNTDPIPIQQEPHRMGTIMIRFVALLLVAVAAMAFIWTR